MRIIIAPAKKMNVDMDSLGWLELPAFLPRTQRLLEALRSMDYAQLKKLWKCSDEIARLNMQRLEEMDLQRSLTPAILAYEGIAFQYMAPGVFSEREFAYVQEHLRILSGFYGLLKPFDGVVPYRLEMQARLSVDGAKDLYAFWGGSVARALLAETDCIVNLASREYSRCVSGYLPAHARMITCTFGEEQDGRILEKGTMCKMARGEMVRFMAENGVERPEQIQAFDRLDYAFSEERSDAEEYIFVRRSRK